MDMLCQRLGMDPLEFRKRNASVTGSTMPIGTPFPSIGLTTILDRVGEHACWRDPLPKGECPRGRGLALGYWRGTSMTSAGHITIAGDGRPMVTMGPVDISGTRTTMAQVVAEEFGLALEDVHIHTGDSKSVGYSDGAAGSRVARTATAALVEASRDALGQLRKRAAEKLQCAADQLDYADGVFRARQAGRAAISLKELMAATLTDGAVIGRGVSTKLPLGVEIGAHVCDVEVDTDTGLVTVLRYTAFQDVGLALNPAAVEGQIEGSVVQGLGWALSEGFDYGPDGRLRNASLLDYRMPTALDVPKIDCVIVETPVPNVPYGVRGVGEVPIVPPGAAVANAIARATGVRMTRMPMTPERVLAALRGSPPFASPEAALARPSGALPVNGQACVQTGHQGPGSARRGLCPRCFGRGCKWRGSAPNQSPGVAQVRFSLHPRRPRSRGHPGPCPSMDRRAANDASRPRLGASRTLSAALRPGMQVERFCAKPISRCCAGRRRCR